MRLVDFYLRVTVAIHIILLGLMLLMPMLGSTQPIHPALRGFVEGCERIPQPCWYGIVPHVTTLEDAQEYIETEGYYYAGTNDEPNTLLYRFRDSKGCATVIIHFSLEYVDYLQLICNEINLGDGLSIFKNSLHHFAGGDAAFLFLYNDIAIGTLPSPPNLYTPIWYIIIPSQLSEEYLANNTFLWHGFAPLWRYCQLEPQNDLCP